MTRTVGIQVKEGMGCFKEEVKDEVNFIICLFFLHSTSSHGMQLVLQAIDPKEEIDPQSRTETAKNQSDDDGTFKLPQAASQRKQNRTKYNADFDPAKTSADASFIAASKPMKVEGCSKTNTDDDDDVIEIVDEIVNVAKKPKVELVPFELPPLPEAPPQPSILLKALVPPKPILKVLKRSAGASFTFFILKDLFVI